MRLTSIIICTILVVSITFMSGCGSSTSEEAAFPETSPGLTERIEPEQGFVPGSETPPTGIPSAPENTEEVMVHFTGMDHAYVQAIPKDWDGDGTENGLVVYPALKDANDEMIGFQDIELDVEVEIWATRFDEATTQEIKDRVVYSKTSKINSWKDGDPRLDGGIKIPYTEIITEATDSGYGGVAVKIHLPDGAVQEASQDVGIQIRAIDWN